MMCSRTKYFSAFVWRETSVLFSYIIVFPCMIQWKLFKPELSFSSQEYKVIPEIWCWLPASQLLWSIKEDEFYMEMASLSGVIYWLCCGLISHLVWSCRAFLHQLGRLFTSSWQHNEEEQTSTGLSAAGAAFEDTFSLVLHLRCSYWIWNKTMIIWLKCLPSASIWGCLQPQQCHEVPSHKESLLTRSLCPGAAWSQEEEGMTSHAALESAQWREEPRNMAERPSSVIKTSKNRTEKCTAPCKNNHNMMVTCCINRL